MSSKLSSATLQTCVHKMMSGRVRRKFVESVELLVGLKNYDPSKDKRFSGVVKLPHVTKNKFRVCILGDQVHLDEAAKLGLDSMDVEALKNLNKNKKLVKKLAQKYNAFLASESVMKQILRLLGSGLSKAGKFPTVITHNEDMTVKVHELHCQVKFQLKKAVCLGVAVGNVNLSEQQLVENIEKAVNFLVSLLKKNWQNVKSLHIKTTMGASIRIF
ncbi:60S ribosomal protein L10a [Pelomyxa schiedti]|nr:60S ribosomal protein L10a [Pelomyxa schiedti]